MSEQRIDEIDEQVKELEQRIVDIETIVTALLEELKRMREGTV